MKRHIRNYPRTWRSENTTIAYWRCGNQVNWDFYNQQLFTPLASDGYKYLKSNNVCENCIRCFFGSKIYNQRKKEK